MYIYDGLWHRSGLSPACGTRAHIRGYNCDGTPAVHIGAANNSAHIALIALNSPTPRAVYTRVPSFM